MRWNSSLFYRPANKTMALTGGSKITVTFLDNEAKKKKAFGAFGYETRSHYALNNKVVNYWKLFHHTTFFSLMNHKIFLANKSKQIEQIKFRIQTIYLFTDLLYASTIVTITLLTIRINHRWKREETIFALRTCSLVYIVLTWTLAWFLVTAEAAIPCTITVAAAFCKGKHKSLRKC